MELVKTLYRIGASAFSLLFAFIVVQAFLELLLYGIAEAMGYSCTYTYMEVFVPMDFHLWNRIRVFSLNFTSPTACLLLGLYLWLSMAKQEEPWGKIQLAAYWFMICLINICLSHLLFAPIGVADPSSAFYETYARVLPWLDVPALFAMPLSIIAILASIGVGYFLSTETVKLSYSQRLVNNNSGKNRIIIELYIIPVLLCAWPLLMLTRGQVGFRVGVMLFNMLLFPMGMFLRNSVGPYRVKFKKMDMANSFPFIELALGLTSWCIIYFFLRGSA